MSKHRRWNGLKWDRLLCKSPYQIKATTVDVSLWHRVRSAPLWQFGPQVCKLQSFHGSTNCRHASPRRLICQDSHHLDWGHLVLNILVINQKNTTLAKKLKKRSWRKPCKDRWKFLLNSPCPNDCRNKSLTALTPWQSQLPNEFQVMELFSSEGTNGNTLTSTTLFMVPPSQEL